MWSATVAIVAVEGNGQTVPFSGPGNQARRGKTGHRYGIFSNWRTCRILARWAVIVTADAEQNLAEHTSQTHGLPGLSEGQKIGGK